MTTTPQATPESKHLLGSLTDPVSTFQHNIETQRNAAMAHETLLVYQLTVLQSDLDATRRMIASCDSALMTLNAPLGDTTESSQRSLSSDDQQGQDNGTAPVDPPNDEIEIPPFLRRE